MWFKISIFYGKNVKERKTIVSYLLLNSAVGALGLIILPPIIALQQSSKGEKRRALIYSLGGPLTSFGLGSIQWKFTCASQ